MKELELLDPALPEAYTTFKLLLATKFPFFLKAV